jgi:hypothetical protein
MTRYAVRAGPPDLRRMRQALSGDGDQLHTHQCAVRLAPHALQERRRHPRHRVALPHVLARAQARARRHLLRAQPRSDSALGGAILRSPPDAGRRAPTHSRSAAHAVRGLPCGAPCPRGQRSGGPAAEQRATLANPAAAGGDAVFPHPSLPRHSTAGAIGTRLTLTERLRPRRYAGASFDSSRRCVFSL